MTWEKTDAVLADTLERLLYGMACQKKMMFGCPVYFAGDNMFTGVKGGTVFLRLSHLDRIAIAAECDEVTPFEPRPGFFMKEYVSLPDSILSDTEFMSKWLNKSYGYTMSLPVKVKRRRKTQLISTEL